MKFLVFWKKYFKAVTIYGTNIHITDFVHLETDPEGRTSVTDILIRQNAMLVTETVSVILDVGV